MIDLEDAVAPNEKTRARGKVVQSLKELDRGETLVLYRVNALDTPFFYRDLIEVFEEAGDALDAVIIKRSTAATRSPSTLKVRSSTSPAPPRRSPVRS